MPVNNFLKRYGMMIGEGTFGALTGGLIYGGLAQKGGEDLDSVLSEAGVGATVGAGSLLALRTGIARNRLAKAVTGFKKSDPRFTQYVDDITSNQTRLDNLTEMLEGKSFDALKEQEFQAIRGAMDTPHLPTSISAVEESIPQLQSRLDKAYEAKSKITKRSRGKRKGEQQKLELRMSAIKRRLKAQQSDMYDDLIDAGYTPTQAKDASRNEFERVLEILTGKPKRDMPIPIGSKMQPSATSTGMMSPNKVVGRLPRTGLESTIAAIRTPESLSLNEAIAAVYGQGANITAAAKRTLGQARGGTGVHNIPGVSKKDIKFGFMPVHPSLQPPFNINRPDSLLATTSRGAKMKRSYGSNQLEFIRRLQSKQGLGYQMDVLGDKVRSAERKIRNLNQQLKTRKNLMTAVRERAKAIQNAPKEIRSTIKNLEAAQNEYFNNFIDAKESSIKSSFLGLGG